MNLRDLIDQYRETADDTTAPYSADDARVTAWLNEAVDEAAVRSRLIFDTSSPICNVSVLADKAVYRLAPCIFQVATAWSDTFKTTLGGTDQSALDRGAPYPASPHHGRVRSECGYWSQWRTWKGRPRFFIQDAQRLQLVPSPTDKDTLHLEVYRTTLDQERMRDREDCPEIAEAHHTGLVDWALYRSYLRRDEEQYDPKVAADHLSLFEQRFGLRPDANVARKRNERRSHVTQINWP